ncbi:MAG: hypothetical protein KC736_01750 [Candidatus Moranbacteria bacterium]|nr:hypothetical protein [Candidatus Moranbacteria bacterium]
MIIRLNLLPEEKKQEIKRKKRMSRGISQASMFFLVLIFVLASMAGMRMVQHQEQGVTQRTGNDQLTRQGYKEVVKYEDIFREMNKDIVEIEKIRARHVEWSPLIQRISQNIVQKNLTIDQLITKDATVMLSGTANTRQELLEFEEQIKNDECIDAVDVPLSNLVVKENVPFQIDATFKKDCLVNS